jgi:hypothetical protein
MSCWITPDGNYYLGDYVAEGSIQVTPRPSDYHEWVDGEWVLNTERQKGDRIAQLLANYDIDREKLNKAWLSALIADGAGEVERQTVIKQQMDDLDVQLETDILNIIMEE